MHRTEYTCDLCKEKYHPLRMVTLQIRPAHVDPKEYPEPKTEDLDEKLTRLEERFDTKGRRTFDADFCEGCYGKLKRWLEESR